jgi:asparagine synthase (glutamine-hydrolysing)
VFRYVALIWNAAAPEAVGGSRALADRLCDGDAGWSPVLRRDGIAVFCKDIRPGLSESLALYDGAGVVLGKLFVRGNDCVSSAAPQTFSETETQAILASGGRRLVDAYWGRYVAFLREGMTDTTSVLRDPTGALPCFNTRLLGVDVYFSHMEEGTRLAGRRAFTVNWPYVAAAVSQHLLQVHATGLNEVAQVLGGECVTIRRGETTRQFLWNALAVAASDPIEDVRDATQLLRIRTRDCVQAWAAGHRSILHLLSGGLDSAIILACLRDSPTSSPRAQLTCLNFHSVGSNTDERGYMRVAAAGVDCEVIERSRNSALSLEPLLKIQSTCIPENNFFYLDGGRVEAELAVEKGSGVVFSGYGGDQLFYQSRAMYGAAEYLTRHGLRPSLFGVALDAARVDRMSVWSVLRTALTHGPFGRRWSPAQLVGDDRPLVQAHVIKDIKQHASLQHPWFQAPRGVSSGKLWQAHQLLFPVHFYNPLGSDTDPEPIAPLLSQPLIELVLRIPTWLLTLGGWDRALARRAFQHEVPRSIVTRRTKGGQEEHAKSILVRNLAFARDLLLQGALVREKILDRERVAEVLSGRPSKTAASNVELYGCLSVEAWLRQWLHAH